MKIDLNILEQYYNNGLLHKQTHPVYDLTIWNYTPKVSYDKLWDEVTLKCRGLVTDSQGNIVALCFPKFFNWEELNPNDIPNEPFEMYEKMDGSLGIVFYYNNEWILASRGSFTSDQAIKGNELLKKENTKYGLIPGWSYCMEIIYPENQIVINYGGMEKLIVLAVYNLETGEEGSIENMTSEGWTIVKKYESIKDFNKIKLIVKDDAEGFVLRFKSGFRMKIKGAEYCRLHSIVTKISNRTIWEYLKDGRSFGDLIERVPDEFYKWIKEQIDMFNEMFKITKANCELVFYTQIPDGITRKEVAEIVLSKDKRYHGILFALYDGKKIDNMIWKLLYPEYSKPYFNKMLDDE